MGSASDQGRYLYIDREWGSLEELWLRTQAQVKPPQSEIDRINTLFESYKARSSKRLNKTEEIAAEWGYLNAAEDAVSSHLILPELMIRYELRLGTAKRREIHGLDYFETRGEEFEKAGANAVLRDVRETYLNLLVQLHTDYINMRLGRELRLEAAGVLLVAGLITTVAAVVMAIVVYWFIGWQDPAACVAQKAVDPATQKAATVGMCSLSTPPFALMLVLVALLGAWGALFSRAMAFGKIASSLTFDNYTDHYPTPVIALRLLYGAIGAVLFYAVIQGGLVAGDIFPDCKETAWQGEFLKLVFWAFLAGFSERLMPDLLAKFETSAGEAAAK